MKEERIYTVYLHTSPSGKYYVGITCQEVSKRWLNGEGYRTQTFYRAIQKYGWDNINHEIVASNLTKEEAENFEIRLIAELHSNKKEFGYNISNGGNVVGSHSEESKRKMSEAHKGENNHMFGKRGELSPNFGVPHSEESRKKMSESHIGLQSGENHPMYGKNHTEESKRKMSESRKGKYVGGKNPTAKKVVCEGITYDCAKDCASHYGIVYGTMKNWLNGRRKMPQDFIDMGLSYL